MEACRVGRGVAQGLGQGDQVVLVGAQVLVGERVSDRCGETPANLATTSRMPSGFILRRCPTKRAGEPSCRFERYSCR